MHWRDDSDDRDPLRGYPRIRKVLEEVDRRPDLTLEEVGRDSEAANPLSGKIVEVKVH